MSLDAVNKLLADMWDDLERSRRDAACARAKADPRKHKLCLVFETKDGSAFRGIRWFWAGQDRRARYHYGVTEKVNAAGYILCWREVSYKKPTYDRATKRKIMGKRDQWAARLSREAALRLAKTRAERHLAKVKT